MTGTAQARGGPDVTGRPGAAGRLGAALGFDAVACLVCALAPVLAALAPRGLAPLTVAGCVLAVLAFRVERGRWPRPPAPAALALGALLAWSAVTVAWTPRPSAGLGQLVELCYTLVPALLFLSAMAESPPRGRRLWIPVGLAVGVALCAVDLLLDMRVHALVRGRLGPDPSADTLALLNRTHVALAALVWPAVLALWALGFRVLGALLPVALGVLLSAGESQSGSLGLMVGVLALGAAAAFPRLAVRLAGILTAALVLATPALKLAAHGLVDAALATLPWSFVQRLEIWRFAAERVLERPILGWGLDSARVIGEGKTVVLNQVEMGVLPLHPHDAFLQIWLELGLVGVLPALALMLLALRGIGRLPPTALPPALAAYASVAAMASVSYGVWQVWWLGAMILGAAGIVIAARGAAAGGEPLGSAPGRDQLRP
jgi:O-antigen ligase